MVVEGFDLNEHGSNPPTYRILARQQSSASVETIQRAAASQFAWGAYCQQGSTASTGRWISMAGHNTTTSLLFDAGSFAAGNYAYTRFDSDASDGNNNLSSRRIDVSGDDAHVSLSVFSSKQDCQVAIMLGDGEGWQHGLYLGHAPHAQSVRLEKRSRFSDSHGKWQVQWGYCHARNRRSPRDPE